MTQQYISKKQQQAQIQEQTILTPKLVRFNVHTSVHMIPDEDYPLIVAELKEMRRKDRKNYVQTIIDGSDYIVEEVRIGQQLEVPGWYYEAHKNDRANIPNSFEHYKDRQGNRTPFNAAEAIRHGDMKDASELTKDVKLFDLVA